MNVLPQTWQILSHKVLSSILVDPGAVFPVQDVLASNTRYFPPKDRPIWGAVLRCLQEGIPPSFEAVLVRAVDETNPDYLRNIISLWTDEDNRRVIYHAQELKRLGMLAQLRAVGKEIADTSDIDSDALLEAIGKAQTELSGIAAEHSDRDPSPESVSKQAWDDLDNLNVKIIPSGLKWFDDMTGGFWPNYNYWVVAARKSGKTTLVRNLTLNVAEAGYPVGMFAAEGSRQDFCIGCQAMIATRLLLDSGYVPDDQRRLRLSTIFLKRAWMIWKKEGRAILTKEENDALQEARAIWETRYKIYVWDSKDHIKDLTTLRHKVKRYKLEHGIDLFFGDYSQIFNPGRGSIYERQSETALTVQDIAAQESVAMVFLSQKSNDSIKGGKIAESSGAKGAGETDDVSDFTLIPQIQREEVVDPSRPTNYKIELHFSRWTMSGNEENHLLNPSSGLIVDRWYKMPGIS